MQHETLEKNIGWMGILVFLVISIAGLVEIVPLFFQTSIIEPAPGVKPYTPLQLAGRDVYVREGCYNCHSQMIRPFVSETERYGDFSVAGESVYDHPFQWGSKRTGPDLARVGGRYTDAWHRAHLTNPRQVVPESNMPGFPWLEDNSIDTELLAKKIAVMRLLGVPYPPGVESTLSALKGQTEMNALISYLQVLGTYRQNNATEPPERTVGYASTDKTQGGDRP